MKKELIFAQCFREILTETSLSASEVARRLGMRSRNHIFRILKGETSRKLNRKFLTDMEQTMPDALTQSQWSRLEDALDMDDVGEMEYRNQRALMQLIQPSHEPDKIAFVRYRENTENRADAAEGGMEKQETLVQFLQRTTQEAQQVTVLMHGCCEQAMIRQIQAGLAPLNERKALSIVHYVAIGQEEAVANIVGIQPIADQSYYRAYLVDPEQCGQERIKLYRSGRILLFLTNGKGEQQCQALFCVGASEFLAARLSEDSQWLIRKLFDENERYPLLHPQWELDHTPEDFIGYTRQYAAIEYDTGVYCIKPDVPFQLIPMDVIYPVVKESFASWQLPPEQTEKLIQALREIHQGRLDNMENKRKPTYLLLNYDQMRQFACTGHETDHFFALRDFTVAERRRILCYIRDLAQRNPYFYLYFSSQRLSSDLREITLYEDRALLTMEATTDYNIGQNHTECHITQPIVLKEYKKFYLDTVLRRYAMSEVTSRRMMDQLIELLDGQLAGEKAGTET